MNGLSSSILYQWDVISIVKACINLTSTHYPQRSHKMIVINVPKWFNALFAMVRPLLNEAQRAKINIFRGDAILPGMRNFIDDDNIPRELGGTSPLSMGQMPDEKALHQFVMRGLASADKELLVDSRLQIPGVASVTRESYMYFPRTGAGGGSGN